MLSAFLIPMIVAPDLERNLVLISINVWCISNYRNKKALLDFAAMISMNSLMSCEDRNVAM